MSPRFLAVMVLCALAAPARAGAQQIAEDAPEQARIRLGPVGVTPSVALTRLGVDTNVFNEFEDPKRDFTFTLSPQVDAWARAGRARLHVAGRSDVVYFERYSSERSLDGTIGGRFEVQGARFTPWVSAGYTAGRQRIGYEVDLRFRRTMDEVAGGVEARAGARTRVALSITRSVLNHDPDAVFGFRNLREVLDRRSHTLGLQLRYALTPLTTFVLSGQASDDRFEVASSRDSRSVRVESGFDLAPSALISGRGRIGYRQLNGTSHEFPEYAGVVASVAAGSTFGGRTRVDVVSERDVTYSWEPDYPYYVLTGATVTVTPRLTERWDVQGRLGGYRLAYRPVIGAEHLLANRVDTYHLRGAGIGFHVGRDLRFGFNVDRERRTSPQRQRFYAGYRAGLSVTYGR
jgi:hypothetical protein